MTPDELAEALAPFHRAATPEERADLARVAGALLGLRARNARWDAAAKGDAPTPPERWVDALLGRTLRALERGR